MKEFRKLIALVAIMAVATILTGCGDDDDGNDNNNNNAGPQFAPGTQAGFVGNTYTVTLGNGQQGTLTFPTAGTYSFTPAGGTAETGAINNINLQGEDWVGTIAPNGAADTVRAGELRAHFTGKNATTFTGTITYQGANGPVTIPFSAVANTGGTNGGNTNGGNTNGGNTNGGNTNGGNTNGGTNGGTTGILGKTLQLNYQPSGGEKFQFTDATHAAYEGGVETATYTYDATTGQLNITRPGGQSYQMVIPPGSTTGAITIVFTQPGSPPENDAATFTLQ
jgi:hypothetical protein